MTVEYSENKILQEDLEYISNYNLPYEKLKDCTILVTGATGLIGVSLIRALLCINREHSLNIKIIGLIRNLEKAKLIFTNLLDRPELEFLVQDIRNEIMYEDKIDYIIHCASVTASKVMIEKPVETILTSVYGTENMLNLAKEKNVKSFVYISSMEMYGSFEKKEVVDENKLGFIDPLNVRSNYPESKRLCENLCIAYLHEHGVPVKIARLSQTFGAGILPGENRVFAQFARSAIEKQNIVLHTKGLSEGNYCYTSDVVTGIFTILLKGKKGEAYNVSNEETNTTIKNMANLVCSEIAHDEIKVIYDIPSENTYGYAVDTKMKLSSEKLRSLGWAPHFNLLEMFKRLILNMD